MAKKDETEIFKCETCGLVTTEKGHLCKPREVKRAYTCEYLRRHRNESEARLQGQGGQTQLHV